MVVVVVVVLVVMEEELVAGAVVFVADALGTVSAEMAGVAVAVVVFEVGVKSLPLPRRAACCIACQTPTQIHVSEAAWKATSHIKQFRNRSPGLFRLGTCL